MPSIRKMKLRQVYHHRVSYREKRFFLHEFPDHLKTLFRGLERSSYVISDIRAMFECEYGINSMLVPIHRVATVSKWRRQGFTEEKIRSHLAGNDVSERVVYIQHLGYFISRLIEADLPSGKYMVCDPIEYRRKQDAGEDLTNVTESHDMRVRGKTLFYDAVHYTYRDSKLIFWFL